MKLGGGSLIRGGVGYIPSGKYPNYEDIYNYTARDACDN